MKTRHSYAVALLISLLAFAAKLQATPGEQLFRDGVESGLSCTLAAPGTVNVDLRSARVQPVFRLDGRNFPAQSAHSASFQLIPRAVGIEIFAAQEQPDPPAALSADMRRLFGGRGLSQQQLEPAVLADHHPAFGR